MSLDFTSFSKYLETDTNPSEVVQALRFAQYAVVQLMAEVGNEELSDCYVSLVMLEDEFLKLAGLEKICMRWR